MYVHVILVHFCVHQLLHVRITNRNMCCVSKFTMKHEIEIFLVMPIQSACLLIFLFKDIDTLPQLSLLLSVEELIYFLFLISYFFKVCFLYGVFSLLHT